MPTRDPAFDRFVRRTTLLLVAGLVLWGAVGVADIILWNRANDLAQHAKAQAAAIQQSRYESVLRSCLQDAMRNAATIAEYDDALAPRLATASPAEKTRLAESRIFFVHLVDAFLPRPKHPETACADKAQRTTRIPLNTG